MMCFQVVFLVKGPIYLVCISCTEEPYESLRGQLELIYGQVVSNSFLKFLPGIKWLVCYLFVSLGMNADATYSNEVSEQMFSEESKV